MKNTKRPGAAVGSAVALCIAWSAVAGCANDHAPVEGRPASRLDAIPASATRDEGAAPRRFVVRVVDAADRPVAGAQVVVAVKYFARTSPESGVVGSEKAGESRAAADGRCEFELRLAPFVNGLAAAAASGTSSGLTEWIPLEGGIPDPIVVRIAAGEARRVELRDEGGSPVEGAVASVQFGGLHAFRLVETSDAAGVVTIGPVPRASEEGALLAVEAPGFESVTEELVKSTEAHRTTLRRKDPHADHHQK